MVLHTLAILYIVTVPCEIWVVFMGDYLVKTKNTVTVPCEIWVVFMWRYYA